LQGAGIEGTAGDVGEGKVDPRPHGHGNVDVAPYASARDIGDEAVGQQDRRILAADLDAKLHGYAAI
jgi:hypothetical protein